MATGPHISLSAEPLFEVNGFPVTNSLVTSSIVSLLIIALAIYTKLAVKPTNKPTGFQNVIEWVVESLYNFVHSVTNNAERTRRFFPLIATFFIFILLNNWVSVIPGVGTIGIRDQENKDYLVQMPNLSKLYQVQATESTHSEAAPEAASSLSENSHLDTPKAEHTDDPDHEEEGGHLASFVPIFRPGTADLNTTLALALISVFITQVFGIQYQSLGYFKKFINFSNPIMFIVGLLEIISELAKILSFAFRLFGNIFAGEVLLVVIAFIGGNFLFFAPMPFYGLEFFVGFIQALVFAMLSLVFFNMATQSHDDH